MGVACTRFRPCGVHWNGFVRRPSSHAPSRTDLTLEIRHEYQDEFMPSRAGEDGIDKVLLDRLGNPHVVGEESRFDGDVWDVVELGDDVVPVVWSCETVRLVCLW